MLIASTHLQQKSNSLTKIVLGSAALQDLEKEMDPSPSRKKRIWQDLFCLLHRRKIKQIQETISYFQN